MPSDINPAAPSPPAAIIADNLTKSYGRTNALTNIDLTIEAHGITAILGANGAGKSTLINCALGLTRPSKGRVRVLGERAGSMAARRRTGVMLQGADLPEQLTAREHIALFASYYPNPLSVDEVVSICNLDGFANKIYSKLSGGQKRRVQFSLAITGQPDLVFLDEPTTGLDTEARRALWQIVRNLRDAGKAIILTTHYLEEADTLAERIVVLHKGKIIADAPVEEIRDAVGGAVITCITRLTPAAITPMPGVRSVREAGRFMEILSSNQTETLKALLMADPDISDLTITKPGLEEAFLDLVDHQKEPTQ